jgi:hypothetical protein
MNFTFPSKAEYNPKQKLDTNKEKIGIAIIGNIKDLPFNELLIKIVNNVSNTDSAKRIIIIDPDQTLLNTFIKAYSKIEIVVILTKKSTLYGHLNIPIFAVKSDSIPGQAGFQIMQSINLVTGKVPATLLYSFLFDIEKNINQLARYRLWYSCSIDVTNAFNGTKPSYSSTKPLHKLIENNYDKTIDVISSTMICACHFSSKQEINALLYRCSRLVNAINHKNIIYVYSVDHERQSVLNEHIRNLCIDNTYFIYDNINLSRDAGKYLLGINSIKSIDNIYKNDGVITLFNDSVLLSNDLTSFSHDYNSSKLKYDVLGCISSNERSWHIQSWFLSFKNKNTIHDYIALLSMIDIDEDNIIQSVIDQMEIGISSFLAIKYRIGVIYPVHTISQINTIGCPFEYAMHLRTALEYIGFPFVKKRLINTLKDEDKMRLLGANLKNYS